MCLGKACRTISEGFPGNAIGIAVVMDMSSGYGSSEDDKGREREIISVIGSPNGSESVTGSQSIALPLLFYYYFFWVLLFLLFQIFYPKKMGLLLQGI